ncbi:hypothetical protein FS837_008846 [Tulasnella sp. UAMH 9824]|nr:hypothetical protein FS837_008846 [Tulasnella sp. UAMH 9824]
MIPLRYTVALLSGIATTYVAFRRPRPTNESSPNEEPIVSEEPVITQEAIFPEEPIVEEPVATEEPIFEEPVAAEEPFVTEEPIIVEEPIVNEEPQPYTHPFITLLVAWTMTLETFQEWLRFTCMENANVAQATNGKAKDIWNDMLDPLFASLAANDGDEPRVIFMHETEGGMEHDGVTVEWLNNRALQLTDVWSAIAYIMSVAASFDDRERTKDWYLELLMVFSILLRQIALSSSDTLTVPPVVHILWTDRRQLILEPFPQNAILASRTDSPSPVNAVPGHALGSKPPISTLLDKLKEYRRAEIEAALEAADVQNNTNTLDKFRSLPAHEPPHVSSCAETIPYLCVMSGGLRPETKLYGLSFNPESIGCAEEKFDLKNADASALLRYLHPRGFVKACQDCRRVMLAMNVQYIQYKRKENGRAFLSEWRQQMVENGVNITL